ncbi:MAG: LacI family DNA-binding transcriptional regulator [Alkalispirochaeta sp.]
MNTKHKKKATLKEVARLAGVSPPAASQALSGKGNVSIETRQIVEAAARSLGYERTSFQKNAIKDQMLTIGLLFNLQGQGQYNLITLREFISSVQASIAQENGAFVLVPCSESESDESTISTIARTNIKGVISFAHYSETLFRALEARGITVLVFNNHLSHNKFLSVALDDFQATYEATKYLIDKGHTNIAYAYTNRPNIPRLEHNRFFGYRKALEESDITYSDELILYYADSEIEKTKEIVLRILAHHQRPSAIVCLDDRIASGIHYIATRAGYRVPEDLSLIAHGDLLDYSLMQTPGITTMRLNPATAAQFSTGLVVDSLVSNHKTIKTIKIQEHLIERGSCRDVTE